MASHFQDGGADKLLEGNHGRNGISRQAEEGLSENHPKS
jgi:hypothetical protein